MMTGHGIHSHLGSAPSRIANPSALPSITTTVYIFITSGGSSRLVGVRSWIRTRITSTVMRTLSASIQCPEAVVFLLFIALRDSPEETLLAKLVFARTRTPSDSPCFSLSKGGVF